MTDDILARLPRARRWALAALGVLMITGIAPTAAAWGLLALCDAVGWWALLVAALAGLAVWRAVRS